MIHSTSRRQLLSRTSAWLFGPRHGANQGAAASRLRGAALGARDFELLSLAGAAQLVVGSLVGAAALMACAAGSVPALTAAVVAALGAGLQLRGAYVSEYAAVELHRLRVDAGVRAALE